MLHRFLMRAAVVLATLFPQLALAAGTLPIALTQQFAFTNCATATNACGTPLAGGKLFFYAAGSNTSVQNSYYDQALTQVQPSPLVLDANGRVPMFFLADGTVHVRLTDANNVSQFDYPSMLVIGPSGGGGGGGGSGVDPTTVSSTGDVKFRLSTEFLTGWIKLNAQTIGNTNSGASQRANADTQNLYVYVYGNCPDAHCPVVGGRSGNALTDFNANKPITVMDCRSRVCGVGLDDMGNTAAGRLLAGNVTSGGGDGVTTPNATGGEANHTLAVTEMPSHNHTLTDPGHSHTGNFGAQSQFTFAGGTNAGSASTATSTNTTGITLANTGGGGAHNTMPPFMLGTWYMKL